jgi:hypothetical protein
MRYFFKSIISNPIHLPNGKAIQFIHIGADEGIIETEDTATTEALTERIRERRGGVAELTKERYDELLKKKSALPSARPRSRQGIQSLEAVPQEPIQAFIQPPSAPVVAVAAEPVAKISSSEPSRPTVGRLKKTSNQAE